MVRSMLAFALSVPSVVFAGDAITLESLLTEMTDRAAVARFPDPAYTCRQFSSYDRASTSAARQDTWFANGDASQYLRVEEVGPSKRKEWVMADMEGPGAIVRIWSANPKGTLRVYLDGAVAIEAPMTEVLGGKWVPAPLSQENSRGWNLYLPIPYAKHCKVTSDSDGFYYQINYRTYDKGAAVTTMGAGEVAAKADAIAKANKTLVDTASIPGASGAKITLEPGKSTTADIGKGVGGAITGITLTVDAEDREAALRSTVIGAVFDGERTIWCPVSDFFGSGVGGHAYSDWYRTVGKDGRMTCRWVMPYRSEAKISLTNYGPKPVSVTLSTTVTGHAWDARSMHFHAGWRQEFPIHAYGARGTQDFNYVEVKGKGVFVGDNLAVMNPVPEWWGEGDEKIYVDGETFPSHFGTGTEDYYGYAWCCPDVFVHPFHAQPRCDGQSEGNNYGHTAVTRVRSLDAIPFTRSFKFDMEVWHWKECDEAYAATSYWYAAPGSSSNRMSMEAIKAMEAEVAKAVPAPPPLPPPFRREGAIECEGLRVASKPDGVTVGRQDMRGFGRGQWSDEAHLWVQARYPGDFVELVIPAEGTAARTLTLYGTKSWDYGIIKISVNGKTAVESLDLYSGQQNKCAPTGAIDLGRFAPVDGTFVLRVEVVGGNAAAVGTRSFIGLDCVEVK